MILKSGYRIPACAKPARPLISTCHGSAGEAGLEKVMLN
jgi:hypothetical protein